MPSKTRRRPVHDDLDFGFYFILAFMAAIPLVLVYVNDLLTSTQPLSKATTVQISDSECFDVGIGPPPLPINEDGCWLHGVLSVFFWIRPLREAICADNIYSNVNVDTFANKYVKKFFHMILNGEPNFSTRYFRNSLRREDHPSWNELLYFLGEDGSVKGGSRSFRQFLCLFPQIDATISLQEPGKEFWEWASDGSCVMPGNFEDETDLNEALKHERDFLFWHLGEMDCEDLNIPDYYTIFAKTFTSNSHVWSHIRLFDGIEHTWFDLDDMQYNDGRAQKLQTSEQRNRPPNANDVLCSFVLTSRHQELVLPMH